MMRAPVRILLAAGAAMLAASPGIAQACVFVAPVYVGMKKPSPEELAARRLRYQREAADSRAATARADLAAGRVDAAARVASLLIPKVRAVVIHTSDCGNSDEFDRLDGDPRAEALHAFDGTELEGLPPDMFEDFFRRAYRDIRGRCNAEFRMRAAARLRRDVKRAMLDKAYVALASAIGDPNYSYFAFVGPERAPPLQVDEGARYPENWPRVGWLLGDARNPINRSLAAFWAEAAPHLGDDAWVCPAAHAEFLAERDAWIARLRARPGFYEGRVRYARSQRAHSEARQ